MTRAQSTLRPANTIKPRKMAFDMTQLQEKYFFYGNPILSTLMYSMSASFPDGERFFIDSVRHFQKDIKDPVLQAQIRGFIGQEAHHGSVHEDFNARAASLGMAMEKVRKHFKKRIDTAKRLLSETDEPIAQIARQSGFNSTNQFYVTFRKHAGISPSDYRAQLAP